MTSFATHRLRVHDRSLPPYRRLSALRTCLTEFAPYGLRATYHHLCRSAGIPHGLALHRLCAGCGLGLDNRPAPRDESLVAAREERWKVLWRRAV
ncbi:hypothetical protein ACIQUQ_22275 [Streptomyces sp. NPDC101118]|uniref:hypothetical protein n=1 Tax=Streptomyces sp. NPDC101118 TaxID=3366109 RepID=UPI0038083472